VNRLRWLLARRGQALALWAGVALVAAALAWHALALRPLAQRVDALQSARPGPRDTALAGLDQALARADSPQARLDRFHQQLAGADRLTDRLAKVHAIARSLKLDLKQADYRLTSQPDRRLARYQMVLPVQGSYPTVRAFISTLLRDLPTMSLDQVQLQRQRIDDGLVDAQITLTFFLLP
jgi:hypothetical protein